MFFDNRRLAIHLLECCIRLDYWFFVYEKSRKHQKDYQYQRGKFYAYAYILMRLSYAHLRRPIYKDSRYVKLITKGGWQFDNGKQIQVFVKKQYFNEALQLIEEKLRKDILQYREKAFTKKLKSIKINRINYRNN